MHTRHCAAGEQQPFYSGVMERGARGGCRPRAAKGMSWPPTQIGESGARASIRGGRMRAEFQTFVLAALRRSATSGVQVGEDVNVVKIRRCLLEKLLPPSCRATVGICRGVVVLGAPIGSPEFVQHCLQKLLAPVALPLGPNMSSAHSPQQSYRTSPMGTTALSCSALPLS